MRSQRLSQQSIEQLTTMTKAFDYVRDRLAQLQRLGLERHLQPHRPQSSVLTRLGDRDLINFSSNDYLGFSQHPALATAAAEAAAHWGTSSSASRLVTGSFELHHHLEAAIATWKGTEAALVFNSGYQANQGVLVGLSKSGDQIFFDALSHASIRDGVTLSRATAQEFRHNDLLDLEMQLDRSPSSGLRIIVSESVFSMDGDCAPLPALLALAETYDCLLVVDEAHAVGYYGAGLVSSLSLRSPRLILVGTCGKALGSFGAYVASTELIQALLINRARSFIYTTALPPTVLAATLAAIALLESEPQHQDRLRSHCQQVAYHLNQPLCSPIVPLILPDVATALQASANLQAAGYWVQAIRPPTVPTPRLRLTLSAAHTEAQIEGVLKSIRPFWAGDIGRSISTNCYG